MPTSRSSKKRVRQNERRRRRNQGTMSKIKTLKKSVAAAIKSGDEDKVKSTTRDCCSALDKAAKKNVLHKNKVARDKSRMSASARRQQVTV